MIGLGSVLGLGGIGLIAYFLFQGQRILYERLWNRGLEVQVDFVTKELFEGESGELSEVVINRKRLSLPLLKVKFQTDRSLVFGGKTGTNITDLFYWIDIFRIGGREQILRKLTFVAQKRGYFRISKLDLVSSDLFLNADLIESRDVDSYLYVYPKPFWDPEFQKSLELLSGEIITRRHLLEDPFEYRGIREYQPYDDLRSINWKATARTGELRVNQRNFTAQQTIRILLNLEDTGILKKESAVEFCIQIAAGITQFYLKKGIRVSLYSSSVDGISGRECCVEAGAGNNQFDRILKTLACIDTQREAVFQEFWKEQLLEDDRQTYTVVVSANAYPEFQRLLMEYGENGGSYIWYIAQCGMEQPTICDRIRPCVRFVKPRAEV